MPRYPQDEDQPATNWPSWAKRIVTVWIVFQIASVLAAEFAGPPASPLERAVADRFTPYYQLVDQGHAHRYYADIPPTPIVTAELRFADGRPNQTIRIPDRSLRPRMLYQRHLALANTLAREAGAPRPEGEPPSTLWAQSYARHLGLANPGCSGVILRWQLHLIPSIDHLVAAATDPDAPPLNPDAEEFYTTPQRIGDFPCNP